LTLEAAGAAVVPLLALLAWLQKSPGLAPTVIWGVGAAAVTTAAVAALVAARHAQLLRRQLGDWNAMLRDLQRARTPPRTEAAPRNELGRTTRRLERLAGRLALRRAVDEVLAQADEALLIKPDRRSLVGSALKCLDLVTHGEVRALALFESQGDGLLTVYLAASGKRRLEILRVEIDPASSQRWRGAPAPATRGESPFPEGLDARLRKEHGIAQYFVLPVSRAGRLWGYLVSGHRAPSAFARADVALLDGVRRRLIAGFRSAEREELLHSLAFVDKLTGLPNRETFESALRERLAGRVAEDPGAAVLVVDVDRFQQVNDAYGKKVADRLLVEVRHRLGLHLAEGDVLARLQGDQFAVLLAHAPDARHAGAVARKMIQSMARSMFIDGQRIYSGASVGVARIPVDGSDAAQLLRKAEIAMVRAKETGRQRVAFYAGGMLTESRRRARLESELRRALKRNEFTLQFEPRYRLDTGALCGARARLAWRHPEHGVLPASAFLEDAQALGLASRIGLWALEEACHQHRRWREAGMAAGQLACRLPAGALARSGFAPFLKNLAARTELPRGVLLLEVDAAELVQTGGHAAQSAAAAAGIGATFAVEAAGGGDSLVAGLAAANVTHLLLDVAGLEQRAPSQATGPILQAAVRLARALGKRTVAGGVERSEQFHLLRKLCCDEAQGELLCPTQAPADFEHKHFGRVLPPMPSQLPQAQEDLNPAPTLPADDADTPATADIADEDLLEAQLTVPLPLSEDYPLTAAG
jgi:diguanylate cyclase (GGDEF)-like protein